MSRILLVEDDPDIRTLYERLLSSNGYDVLTAKDGAEGWETLQKEGDKLDLVLLDVVLPKKDGFDILKALRHDGKLHHLKVVLLTNLAQDADRKMGAKLNATDYVVKAHTTNEALLEKVEHYLDAS
jgi:two-component system, OmpR family, response regulator ResD